MASSYTVRYRDFETGFLDESNAPNVAAYFLNVRNPESVDANGSHFSQLTLPDGSVTTNETFARKAIERGADGVMIYNTRDDADPRNQSVSDVFTAKNAHAIKSAWGNTGAFDEVNNDIRFSMDEVVQRFNRAAPPCLFLPQRGFAVAHGFSMHTAFDAFQNNLGISTCLRTYTCTDNRATEQA